MLAWKSLKQTVIPLSGFLHQRSYPSKRASGTEWYRLENGEVRGAHLYVLLCLPCRFAMIMMIAMLPRGLRGGARRGVRRKDVQ